MSRDAQIKITCERDAVFSEPFASEPPPSQEVMHRMEGELLARLIDAGHLPGESEIKIEIIPATMITGMYGFMKSVMRDVTPNKESE